MTELIRVTNHENCSIVLDTLTVLSEWCIFEHWAQFQADQPPECILVGVCKLIDVYKLIDGKTNSEWTRIFKSGGQVMVRVVKTVSKKHEGLVEARRHMLSLPKVPICNHNGYAMFGGMRRIISSTGETYNSQAEAANALGVTGPAVSRHMNGFSHHVRGVTLRYAAPEQQ